jgi:hypothetical protein
MFSSLRYRDYRNLWVGTGLVSGANWIQQLTVGWLAYDMTVSSALAASVPSAPRWATRFFSPSCRPSYGAGDQHLPARTERCPAGGPGGGYQREFLGAPLTMSLFGAGMALIALAMWVGMPRLQDMEA